MFSDCWEELTLMASIMDYLTTNKGNIDENRIKQIIEDSSLDDEQKQPIMAFLEDYSHDNDAENLLGNLQVACDLINERAI